MVNHESTVPRGLWRERRWFIAVAILVVISSLAPIGPAAAFGPSKTFDEIVDWAQTVSTANPDLVELFTYGHSVGGRPLIALHITADVDQARPDRSDFVFTGGLHANEVIGGEAAWRLADRLIAGYGVDPAITDVLDTREAWVFPMMNPDGRAAVEGGLHGHRKNRAAYGGQSPGTVEVGVDLNRNFPHQFGLHDTGIEPRHNTWGGPEALSEPETARFWEFLHDGARFDDIAAAIDYHGGAETLFVPWINRIEHYFNPMAPEDAATFARLTDELFDVTGYDRIPLWYSAWGTLSDSLFETFGTYAFTQELVEAFYPDDQVDLDARTDLAFDAAMVLLQDDALVVPEPATVVLLTLGFAVALRRHK